MGTIHPPYSPATAKCEATPIQLLKSDRALTATLKRRAPYAADEFYGRYGRYIRRVLMRVMGMDGNFSDILQEVYLAIFSNIHSVQDGNRLKAWITSVTVFTARQNIKKTVRHRAVWADDDEPVTELTDVHTTPETREAVRLIHGIINELPLDERDVFYHRFIEGMDLEETAEACGVSLSTVNRRLARAKQKFGTNIQGHPLLEKWIAEGQRWCTEASPSKA